MSSESEDITEAVYNAIEDYIFETHNLCSIREIQERTELGRAVCDKALEDLIHEKKVYVVYQRQGVPTIYVPSYMMNEILMTQSKPRWIEHYRFTERNAIDTKIRRSRGQLVEYEMFERLLYATGNPLEEAVYFSLRWLGIENAKHNISADRDIQDIDFELDGTKYLVEVKGKSKPADKDDVEELNGWRKQEVLKEENEGKAIQGILVINHFRKTDPKERGEPLTTHAKKWLRMYQLKLLTTPLLFDLIQKAKHDRLSSGEAIEIITQGERSK